MYDEREMTEGAERERDGDREGKRRMERRERQSRKRLPDQRDPAVKGPTNHEIIIRVLTCHTVVRIVERRQLHLQSIIEGMDEEEWGSEEVRGTGRGWETERGMGIVRGWVREWERAIVR